MQRRIDLALETADRIAARVETGDELYALGFVEGVEAGSQRDLGDCDATLSSSFSRPYRSGWKDQDDAWRDGFEDGSRLAYSLVVARRLHGCFYQCRHRRVEWPRRRKNSARGTSFPPRVAKKRVSIPEERVGSACRPETHGASRGKRCRIGRLARP